MGVYKNMWKKMVVIVVRVVTIVASMSIIDLVAMTLLLCCVLFRAEGLGS